MLLLVQILRISGCNKVAVCKGDVFNIWFEILSNEGLLFVLKYEIASAMFSSVGGGSLFLMCRLFIML